MSGAGRKLLLLWFAITKSSHNLILWVKQSSNGSKLIFETIFWMQGEGCRL